METVEIFKNELFEYIKARPREWIRPLAFRMNVISADLGYVEYFVLLNHRESWQQMGALKNSLSDVQQFCFELSASLGMGFESPPLPIQMDATSVSCFSDLLSAANNPTLTDRNNAAKGNNQLTGDVVDE
mmetsp:Transcript_4865/g.7570  ORF Transcript_4865/g.7570 Transcript_4865/m.7570 type:complete len:130 (-) Transcript_4865:246-635(-)